MLDLQKLLSKSDLEHGNDNKNMMMMMMMMTSCLAHGSTDLNIQCAEEEFFSKEKLNW